MKITYITAGAGGMYCGNCLRDNTLAATLRAQGHDVTLVPLYTPILTDEEDVSLDRVFYGGLNVYLQQQSSLFRHTPKIFDSLLDAPGLLRWVSGFAIRTAPQQLGELTLSVLEGEEGRQRKELDKLLDWMRGEERPQAVHLTNSLLAGLAGPIKRALRTPVFCSLQGEDVFINGLPAPYRERSLQAIRERAADIDAFLAPSNTYADSMADFLQVPRHRIHIVYPGLKLEGHGARKTESKGEFVIGYMSRVHPDKGLHLLADAFRILRKSERTPNCRLRVAGYLDPNDRPYLEGIRRRLRDAGLENDFEFLGTVDRKGKIAFLQSLDTLAVPTTYAAPKGLYMLEAWANGVPVVEPRHGSFPEFMEKTGGGLLHKPNSAEDLAAQLRCLIENPAHAAELGEKGRKGVAEYFNAEKMTEETLSVYHQYVS